MQQRDSEGEHQDTKRETLRKTEPEVRGPSRKARTLRGDTQRVPWVLGGRRSPHLLSPPGFVLCSGGPCGHTAHTEPLASGLSFAPKAPGPQCPPPGPTPTLLVWGGHWVPRAPRPHQGLAHLSPPRTPSPVPVCWPPPTPAQRTEVMRAETGTRSRDHQGGPYQAGADQLGLQPPQLPEDAVLVGSEGPQDLLQGCPGLRLTALRQPLTEHQQCI